MQKIFENLRAQSHIQILERQVFLNFHLDGVTEKTMMKSLDSLTPSGLFGELPILRVRCKVNFQSNALSSQYLGSAWRGLIGWEMKKHVCPFCTKGNCNLCIIQEHCPYFILLEKKSSLPGLFNSPRGYIFCPSPLDSENNMFLDITLFGSCTKLLAIIVKCIISGQKTGLGATRETYEILGIEQILPNGSFVPITSNSDNPIILKEVSLREWMCSEDNVFGNASTLHLATPLRLRKKGKYLSAFDLSFFLSSIARRLEALNCIFNKGQPMGKGTWEALVNVFERGCQVESILHWYDFKRYSNRQRTLILLGGLVGTVKLFGIDPLIECWIRAATIVHVGKGASMGLGKISMT